ncbi:MAG: SGNH/GDSL hydrolase family protein [Arenicella sp.]|nr:SGNH/GDSL hydrolase family protein [Arenicella sp.]
MRTKISFLHYSIKRITRFIATLVLLFIGVAQAAEEEPYEAVVVLFGDSTTTGFNAAFQNSRFGSGSTTLGCPTIYLNNILRQEEPRTDQQICSTEAYDSPILDQNKQVRNAIVANWGFGGSDTTNGEGRISSNLSETKVAYEADNYFVLIMYGTNDNAFGVSTSTTNFNIRQMIIKARALSYQPIVGTILPRDDLNVQPYNSEIVNAANQEGAFVVDHASRFISQPGGWQSLIEQEVDPATGELVRLHPNDQGYLIIAETWFDQRLKDLIPGISNFNITPIMSLLLGD